MGRLYYTQNQTGILEREVDLGLVRPDMDKLPGFVNWVRTIASVGLRKEIAVNELVAVAAERICGSERHARTSRGGLAVGALARVIVVNNRYVARLRDIDVPSTTLPGVNDNMGKINVTSYAGGARDLLFLPTTLEEDDAYPVRYAVASEPTMQPDLSRPFVAVHGLDPRDPDSMLESYVTFADVRAVTPLATAA